MLLELSSVLGLAGGLFQRWMDLKKEKETAAREVAILREKNAHDQIMRDKDLALMEAEAKNAMAIAELGARSELDKAAYASLSTALQADRATYSDRIKDMGPVAKTALVMVDVVRGLTRPGLTIILVVYVGDLMQRIPTTDPLYETIAQGILSLAFTAVGFWFGARGSDILPKKKA